MGQATSLDITCEDPNPDLTNRVQFTKIRSSATITYKEVFICIEELNSVTCGLLDRAGKQLKFIIKRGSDTTIFWKATMRIYCLKLSVITSIVESRRLLTLRQFVRIHREITNKVSAMSNQYDDNFANNNMRRRALAARAKSHSTSALFASSSKNQQPVEVKEKECCVCMDRSACLMLSCNHEFCEVCIDKWTRDDQHSNCPLCRKFVGGKDDTWVLTDKLDAGDCANEVDVHLMGLGDSASNP